MECLSFVETAGIQELFRVREMCFAVSAHYYVCVLWCIKFEMRVADSTGFGRARQDARTDRLSSSFNLQPSTDKLYETNCTIARNNNGASHGHLYQASMANTPCRHEIVRRRSQCCFAFASSRRQIWESLTRGEHGTFSRALLHRTPTDGKPLDDQK